MVLVLVLVLVLVRQSGTSAETNVGTLPFISFKVTSMNHGSAEQRKDFLKIQNTHRAFNSGG